MKKINCPYCGKTYSRSQTEGTILYRCKDCKVMMLVDVPKIKKNDIQRPKKSM